MFLAQPDMDSIVSKLDFPSHIPFVLVAQANCRKQHQATAELSMYMNSAMRHYKLDSSNEHIINRRKPKSRQKRAGPQGNQNDSRNGGNRQVNPPPQHENTQSIWQQNVWDTLGLNIQVHREQNEEVNTSSEPAFTPNSSTAGLNLDGNFSISDSSPSEGNENKKGSCNKKTCFKLFQSIYFD